MAFELEELRGRKPTRLIDEHGLLMQWLAENPAFGRADALDARLVDGDQGLALYYIQGFGMGECMSFALLRGREIYVFDATRAGARDATVGCVSIPEGSDLSREEIQTLIATSFACYASLVGFSYLPPGDWSLSFERSRWDVRPKKHSLLYFRQVARVWIDKQGPRLRRLVDFLKSPLLALLLLAGTIQWHAPPAWGWLQYAPLLLAAAWFISRLLTFDTDYLFRPWVVGLVKLRNPLQVFERLGRLSAPRPLRAATASIDFSGLRASMVRITVSNRSPWPIGHLSLTKSSLAALVAPRCLDDCRAGRLDKQAFEARIPDLRRRWLAPFGSVTWAVKVQPQDLPSEMPVQLEVLLSISRSASGERRSGLNSYLISVTVLKH